MYRLKDHMMFQEVVFLKDQCRLALVKLPDSCGHRVKNIRLTMKEKKKLSG